jgi:hypothetical protein
MLLEGSLHSIERDGTNNENGHGMREFWILNSELRIPHCAEDESFIHEGRTNYTGSGTASSHTFH